MANIPVQYFSAGILAVNVLQLGIAVLALVIAIRKKGR
jgi:hypothetical protein